MSDWIWALIIGFVLDLLLGDPSWLYHPVCIIGNYISWMEKKLRRRGGNLRKSAVFLTVSTVLLTMAVVALILMLCGLLGRIPLLIAMALLDWMGIAITSMAKEARGVEKALGQGVDAGRTQVARIVGRDTQDLSEEEIIKATVETVSENTTDGVISPLLYAAIGGPILLWGFKAASTLDSMVGYLDEKYRDIGWSSAKLDDVLNYIPARLTALLMVIARPPRPRQSQKPQLRVERIRGGGGAAHPTRRDTQLLRQTRRKTNHRRRGSPCRTRGYPPCKPFVVYKQFADDGFDCTDCHCAMR